MRLQAFRHDGKQPEIKPRKHLIEGGDDSKLDAFIEDLQIAAFGAICDPRNPAKAIEVDDGRKKLALDRFSRNFQGFLRAPQISHDLRKDATQAVINAFSVKGDWPQMLQDRFSILQGEEDYDTNYELLFEPAIKDPGKEYFEVATISRGVTFRRMAEGQKVVVERMSGSKFQVYDAWFAAAIGWTEQAIRYRRLQELADISMAFRDAMQSKRASDYYTLINSAAATNSTTYDTTGSTVQDKDAITINSAYVTMMRRLYGVAGYGSATGQRVAYLFIAPELETRVRGALAQRYQAYQGAEQLVRYPIIPVVSLNASLFDGSTLASGSDGVLVIPGRKNKKHTELAPTSFRDQDIYSMTYVEAVWMSHSGCAEADQVQKVNFS
jgi:hypothetical protein